MRIVKANKVVKASTVGDSNEDSALEAKWIELTDVPFDENEKGELILAEDWWEFPAGTSREDIWHYFDTHHSKGVHWLLYDFNGDGVKACGDVKASKKLSANDQAMQHIKAAIDILGKSGNKDAVTKDTIANLGVVLFDMKSQK